MKTVERQKGAVLDDNVPDSTHCKGERGENLAAEHLLGLGYEIICRQYRSRMGEIDCIARDRDGTLVFIEVKSSSNDSAASPLHWVTSSKQRTIFKVAKQYLAEHGIAFSPCRFDVIAITRGKIAHIRNAFIAM